MCRNQRSTSAGTNRRVHHPPIVIGRAFSLAASLNRRWGNVDDRRPSSLRPAIDRGLVEKKNKKPLEEPTQREKEKFVPSGNDRVGSREFAAGACRIAPGVIEVQVRAAESLRIYVAWRFFVDLYAIRAAAHAVLESVVFGMRESSQARPGVAKRLPRWADRPRLVTLVPRAAPARPTGHGCRCSMTGNQNRPPPAKPSTVTTGPSSHVPMPADAKFCRATRVEHGPLKFVAAHGLNIVVNSSSAIVVRRNR